MKRPTVLLALTLLSMEVMPAKAVEVEAQEAVPLAAVPLRLEQEYGRAALTSLLVDPMPGVEHSQRRLPLAQRDPAHRRASTLDLPQGFPVDLGLLTVRHVREIMKAVFNGTALRGGNLCVNPAIQMDVLDTLWITQPC
jgi:hypothetical protein